VGQLGALCSALVPCFSGLDFAMRLTLGLAVGEGFGGPHGETQLVCCPGFFGTSPVGVRPPEFCGRCSSWNSCACWSLIPGTWKDL